MHKFTSASAERAARNAFERVRRRSIGVADEILAEEGGAMDDASFALAVGCAVAELLARASAHQFFFIEHRGSRHWPHWQLGLPGLAEILTVLTAKGAHGFTIANFFLCQTDVLYFSVEDPRRANVRKSDSPLTLLRRVGPPAVKLAVQHAERFGEHGAT
jgi:hypothetical protein